MASEPVVPQTFDQVWEMSSKKDAFEEIVVDPIVQVIPEPAPLFIHELDDALEPPPQVINAIREAEQAVEAAKEVKEIIIGDPESSSKHSSKSARVSRSHIHKTKMRVHGAFF